jgi:hypothetical protein
MWVADAVGTRKGRVLTAGCTSFDVPQIVRERCLPTGGSIDIVYAMFDGIFNRGDGGAIYVGSSTSVVQLRADAFFNCSAGAVGSSYAGGCVYLYSVKTGTGVSDCCAAKCGADAGSFWFVWSPSVDVNVTGLAVGDCASCYGAIDDRYTRGAVSGSNFTSLNASWGSTPVAAAIWQGNSGASTTASFVAFVRCVGGYGTFYENYGGAATFSDCRFEDSTGAVAHDSGATAQDFLTRCFFLRTAPWGSQFANGKVTLVGCLFAAEVSLTASFLTSGVQVSFTSTAIVFDTASLLATCGGVAGLPERVCLHHVRAPAWIA